MNILFLCLEQEVYILDSPWGQKVAAGSQICGKPQLPIALQLKLVSMEQLLAAHKDNANFSWFNILLLIDKLLD